MALPTELNPHWLAGGVTQYKIERSLRFNSADSAYLDRTPASAGNRRTWTWSAWVKLGTIGNWGGLFNAGTSGDQFAIYLFTDSTLYVQDYASSVNGIIIQPTQVFRDPSAWYHIVVSIDTTQATSTNRVKIYINGSQVTAFSTSTYPSQNYDTQINSTSFAHNVGRNFQFATSTAKYFDGYMTEINFVDGSALTPSSFGETDTDTGVWKPKAYSGSYGTNGFYLKFADNSGTTSTTLGKDSSGNGNNWTPNNFSVTAGAGNDSLVDTPNNYGTDTGAGGEVRGNYCTLNPLSTSRTLTNGNLYTEVNGGGGANVPISATVAIPTTGKWYWEITAGGSAGGGNGGWDWGIVNITVPNFRLNNLIIAGTGGCFGVNGNDGNFRENNVTGISNYISGGITNGDVAQVAYDADNGKLWLGKNNTWGNDGSGNGDPAAGLRPAKTAAGGMTGQFIPVFEYASDSGVVSATANFGQRPFAYTAPSGFKALCTQNLPTPTIGATATTRADDYFNTVLYTGNGNTSSHAITGVGFQPDFVWIKARSQPYEHNLLDAVRGPTKLLFSSLTNAESTTVNFNSFDSDGFNVDAAGGASAFNENNTTYVSWNWKANGAGSINNAGSIQSTVSANTTAGFSIVTYTGTGVNATVGHGLGVAPQMVIVKNRTSVINWPVWHIGLTSGAYAILLDTQGAEYSQATVWNSTTPTSSVISVGTVTETNKSGDNYVAYCFAPVANYSSFGEYVGNGSSDGPFIYTGFRPACIIFRVYDGVANWLIHDNKRNTYNVVDKKLFPNQGDAEATADVADFLSNGFKLKGTNTQFNGNGYNYIYAAFAESPFKYSLAR